MLLGRRPLGTVAFMGGCWAVPPQFAWCWGQMVQYNEEFLASGKGYIHYDRTTYSDHAPARNDLVNRFLGDWLLQLDTDHEFEPDLLARLLRRMNEAGVDVVCGMYRYKQHPHSPVYQVPVNGDGEQRVASIAKVEGHVPKLLEIAGGGAGCLLVRRQVFQRIQDELGQQPFDRIGVSSEDQSFFLRLRELKCKAYLAVDVESWHLRANRVTESDCNVVGFRQTETHAVQGFD